MANTPDISKQNAFTKGMVKDPNETYIGEGQWTHARNLVNNSHDGQVGVVGNEPSNLHCVTLPYTLIGCIPAIEDKWILFTTDNTDSEIGLFNDVDCSYTTIVNAKCLNFNTKHLITGAARRTFDCSVQVYWADGNNPDRVLDINNIPWVRIQTIVNGCVTYTNTTNLDCDRLRLAPLLTVPCIRLEKATGAGTLRNGTYQVAIAYMVNEIKVTDYLVVSNPVSIFGHSGVGGSLTLSVNNTDDEFSEIEVTVISIVNGQTVAKKLGVYSTRQSIIYIDSLDPTLVTIPIENIPIITPAIEKSEGIFPLNNYLLRTGVYTKPDFNYQPLANQIITKWVKVKYPQDYYQKGGANVGYMRDEVYSFFIRWVYNTGDRSASYHIPGIAQGVTPSVTPLSGFTSDGGELISEGLMDFWESTERYPDDNPTVWNSFPNAGNSVYNLCGKNIRHHKFPDNTSQPHFEQGGDYIYVMGVKFSNIQAPKDINGNIISTIVGWEILRGSREGQKSVIAKGMVNHMKEYDIIDAETGTPLPGVQSSLMQNYPYNDITNFDPFYDTDVNMRVNRNYASFHSPDTTFQNPYIGNVALRTYGTISGVMQGTYNTPYKHPEFKIIGRRGADLANVIAGISALAKIAALLLGDQPLTIHSTNDLPLTTVFGIPNSKSDSAGGAVYTTAIGIINAILYSSYSAIVGIKLDAQKIVTLIESIIGTEQFAKQFNSHAFYNIFTPASNIAFTSDYGYIKDSVQSLGGKTINNLYRNPYVCLNLNGASLPNPVTNDDSLSSGIIDTATSYSCRVASHYSALKVELLSQYGQIESVRQVPITSCVYTINDNPVLFGGDTYINRYTEKNNYLFFNDWLLGQPEDTIYNYRQYQNIVGTRFWVDNRSQYVGNADSVISIFLNIKNSYNLYKNNNGSFYTVGKSANADSGWKVDSAYFYLSCNGVKDFFVESEVNVGYRDWDDDPSKRFFDPYGYQDLNTLFRSDIIKASAYYKYDYSLSVSRMYNQFITWGDVLSRSFNPLVAETCYSFFPRRIHYSLPQAEELKRDNWRSFLVNNYKDMPDDVTCVKSINKTGALIMMKLKAPVQIMGVDSMQTDTGIKVTIGDGGLFNQPLQSLVNSDEIYQYGSCQNRWSVISTPVGVVYVSQDQGKVFLYSGQLEEISRAGMKWWFSRFLPSYLKKLYPNYQDYDNPVDGSGVLTVYDNINEVIYITKRDYIAKRDDILYDPTIGFYILGDEILYRDPYPYERYGCPIGSTLIDGQCVDGESVVEPELVTFTPPPQLKRVVIPVKLCDTAYFEDASWTISYDVKNKQWISFHDWHPTFMLPSKTHFLTANKDCGVTQTSLWRHNLRFDSFCNFYGKSYPFEIEYVFSTGMSITTLKSVEYYLECYKYGANGQDKFHMLDYNFDEAVVYNSEQISGLLKLNLKSKSNPLQYLQYPIINPTGSTEIIFSKEEQKYRFNQFNDITKDRGEFSNAENILITTFANGYSWFVNPFSVDYYKSPTQRKKFRHNITKVLLRKDGLKLDPQGILIGREDIKMLFKFINNKLQVSQK